MRKIWDIHGGVHPPENKSQSVAVTIADIPLPDELIIPLGQHIGSPAVPCVEVDERVLKGQVIASAQGVFSASVHASTSGQIIAIEDRAIAHPSGLTAPCIIIKPDGRDQWCKLEPCENYNNLDHHQLINKIQNAGLAGMGGAGFPTAVKLNPSSTNKIKTLILNGTECEPYITADDRLMREAAHGIIEGAKLLANIVGNPKQILIGIEDNKPEAIKAMQEASIGSSIDIVVFPTKYPSGGEKQLIQILTGQELPSGKLPAHIGVLVQNVGTAYAAWRAVRFGEPLIERVTTVVGEALQIQRNIRARIGTPIKHLLNTHGFDKTKAARLVIGGPMMGFSVADDNVPVVKTTNCLLAPSHHEMPAAPPAQACIRCGMCAEACPASLLPQQLYWYAKAEDYDRLTNHNLFDCIECGACSFVCPSAIPLVQYYRAAKGTIRLQDAEKQKSDRARARFDQRKERLAKVEAQKEAKREARKKAAEVAKKQLAEKNKASEGTNETLAQPDLVNEAIARAKIQAVDPVTQLKKLNRAISSAQSRVDRVQAQLTEADETQQEKLQASLKQAQLKVKAAQEKLADFTTNAASNIKSGTPNDNAGEAATSEATVTATEHNVTIQAAKKVQQKLTASPMEAQTKAVATIAKRLAAAEKKLAEATTQNAPTVDALSRGAERLKAKLAEAQQELDNVHTNPAAKEKTTVEPETMNAASAAIAKAQAKAAATANQSDDEKRLTQINSLKTRITKAQTRLAQAQAEGSEHIETLQQSLDKLQVKLTALETK